MPSLCISTSASCSTTAMAPQFLVSALLTEAVLIGMRDPSIKLSMLAKTLIEQYEQRHGAALRPHKPTRKRRKP
jgi:hypothetical protein